MEDPIITQTETSPGSSFPRRTRLNSRFKEPLETTKIRRTLDRDEKRSARKRIRKERGQNKGGLPKEMKLTLRQVYDSIIRNHGLNSRVAQELGVTPGNISWWVKKYPQLMEARNQAKEVLVDEVEGSLFHNAIVERDVESIKTVLYAKGKERGYNRVAGGAPMIPLTINIVPFSSDGSPVKMIPGEEIQQGEIGSGERPQIEAGSPFNSFEKEEEGTPDEPAIPLGNLILEPSPPSSPSLEIRMEDPGSESPDGL
jgi:transcriptional regulator